MIDHELRLRPRHVTAGQTARVLAVSVLVALNCAAVAQPQQEAANPQALRALDTLMGPAGSLGPGEVLDGPVAAAEPSARQRVVVRRGETLDGVIRRTLGDLPVSATVLRGVFIEVNPRAFPTGAIQRLPAGMELLVPAPADLRRYLQASGAASAPMAGRPPVAAASAPAADKRHWVRYP